MAGFDLKFTLIILFIIVFAYLAISAWDEFLDRVVFKLFGFDQDSIIGWFVQAIIATAILIGILYYFQLEFHELLGIPQSVEVTVSKRQRGLEVMTE